MSSIKNSKKNDIGNLLPQRRPRLARYIALAVILHVAFVIVYIYFTQRKPEDRAEVRTPPVKVVPLSPQKNELRRHPVESPSASSFRAASRPMTPSRLMSLPDRNNSLPPPGRSDSPPMNQFIHPTKSNLITASALKGVFPDRKADPEMEAWPDKQISQADMQLVSRSGSHFAAPFPKRPAQPPAPLPISGWQQLIGLTEPFQSSLPRKQDTAIVDPLRSPAKHPALYLPEKKQLLPIGMKKGSLPLEQTLPSRNQMVLINELRPEAQRLVRQPIVAVKFKFLSPEQGKVSLPPKIHTVAPGKPALKNFAVQMLAASPAGPDGTDGVAAQARMNPADVQTLALRAEIRSVAPLKHRPFSQPQTRPVNADKILQPINLSEESSGSARDAKSEKKPFAATSLPFPEGITADLQAAKPSRLLQPGKLPAISQKENLSREKTIGAVRIETTEKATYLRPKTVWQEEPELLPPLSKYAPLQPDLPQLIEDHLADVVKRLIQPALQKYSEPVVRILAKNLTYRDLGLESEGTKFLSGLLKAEIEKQDGLELLSPADVSRNPQIVIEGEMWDHSDKIQVRLWSLDRRSGRRMSTADLSFQREMVPGKVKIQPPSGKNLSMIQRMVELMKQNFPRGGDFQLGVWPDKGLDAVYLEGESLMVYILPEKDAFLHVDYYQIDGKVVHLLPSQNESNYVKAGDPYIIGDPKSGGYEFKVTEPFGQELLVVVASQNPLGVLAHDLIEPADPYIKRLAESLGMQREKGLMAGSHYIVLTKKRE
jgi:hypothetical protein